MNLQAQRDLSIAGDVVGRDKITINLTRGLDELPTRYDSRVQNFLEYYLGSEDQPAPFGGRASDLAALDAWLDDPAAPPYASLIAPAGRGKSALLAHWITRLASRLANDAEAVHIVYFPISIRFNTNLETVVFASLAARIAHVFGEKVTYTPDTNQYRGVFSDYLRRTPPNGGCVLVVMDGLDEAAGWEAGADLFPTVAPGHLRVIVAARPLALDKDVTAWLNRLGWEMPNRAQRISLAGLDREGVRDVLGQMGNPLDALATKIDLISRLYELSAGDPLLVRLYVEALLPQGAQAATLTPEDLAKLQPGLEAYFKRWFEEQQKLWGGAKPLQDKTVRGLLNLCAAALGPLRKDDVLALAPDIFEDSGLLDEAAAAVNRFIIGDGLASGYVFSHPRLAEYFAAKLTNREREAWQARFLQYGRHTLTALENKTLLPKNAPAYVVQYYGAHLVQTKASATDFYALVCESWLRAWEWLEGTPAGFLNDAERAWQKAEAERPAALGQQIRAALCFASVASLSANIPKDLLVACVKAGVISPALGLIMARQKPDPKERAECLAAMAEFQPSSEFHAIMSEALLAAHSIADRKSRAQTFEELALRLPQSLLAEELAAVHVISDEWYRTEILKALAPRLPENLLGEALAATRAISSEGYRAEIFKTLVPRLSGSLLDEALSLALATPDGLSRANILKEIATRLPEFEQTKVFREALTATRAISDEAIRAHVLEELTPRLPESLLGEVILLASKISIDECRARILGVLASRLPEHKQKEIFDEALRAARVISYEATRAEVLGELALRLPKSEQMEVLDEALKEARTISDKVSRAKVMGQLAAHLPKHQQEEVFAQALSAVGEISYGESSAHVLKTLAPLLPESQIGEALSVAKAISDEQSRALALETLAPLLPENLLREALSVARAISIKEYRARALGVLASVLPKNLVRETPWEMRAISDEWFRAFVLVELGSRLPEREQAEFLGEALSSAFAIAKEWPRSRILRELMPLVPESMFGAALLEATKISDEQDRAFVLMALAKRLPKEMLREALMIARDISDAESHTRVLVELALRLPEREKAEILGEALSKIDAISDAGSRALVLAEIAQLLPEHERMEAIRKAYSVACTASDEQSRAFALGNLAQWLPESLLGEMLASACAILDVRLRAEVIKKLASRLSEREQIEVFEEVLSAAHAIPGESYLAYVLMILAPSMPENFLGKALAIVRMISYEWYRTEILMALSPRLPESLIGEALAAALLISDQVYRAGVLEALAPRLPEPDKVELLGKEMTKAREVPNEQSRAQILRAFAPHLQESLLAEALQMARTLCHHEGIIAALSSLASRWSAVCRSTQRSEFEELSATLRAFARTKRPQLLRAIQALLPVIAEQGGIPALRETARAIVDTAKWWP